MNAPNAPNAPIDYAPNVDQRNIRHLAMWVGLSATLFPFILFLFWPLVPEVKLPMRPGRLYTMIIGLTRTLPIAVAFAACLWMALRMWNKKAGWLPWLAVGAGLLLNGLILSFFAFELWQIFFHH